MGSLSFHWHHALVKLSLNVHFTHFFDLMMTTTNRYQLYNKRLCLTIAPKNTVPKILLSTCPSLCPGRGNQRSSSSAGNIVNLLIEKEKRTENLSKSVEDFVKLDQPVAGQIQICDVRKEESSMGWKTGQTIVM